MEDSVMEFFASVPPLKGWKPDIPVGIEAMRYHEGLKNLHEHVQVIQTLAERIMPQVVASNSGWNSELVVSQAWEVAELFYRHAADYRKRALSYADGLDA